MMYPTDLCIELYINTWISDTGELFDFNTSESSEYNSFRASIYKLPIPKHKQSEHFYFIHQTAIREDQNQFILERRLKLESKLDLKSNYSKNYKLIGCFKVYLTQEGDKKSTRKCFVQLIDLSDVKVERDTQNLNKQKPYIIVKSFPQGYPLKQNQIIKLGKLQYKIYEIALQPSIFQISPTEILHLDDQFYQNTTKITTQPIKTLNHADKEEEKQKKEEEKKIPNCRICYDPGFPDDPLVKPCKCSGEICCIHIQCLKRWIDVKLKKFKSSTSDSSNVYNTKELFCEICKEKFPKKIIFKGKEYVLLTFMQDYMPYISLKSMADNETNQDGLMFVTVEKNKNTTIGRSDENGMILLQNSVSRKHALIKLGQSNKSFVIQDSNSKYGTLVYEKGAQFRLTSKMRAIEIGNTVFSFKLIQKDYST